MKYRGIAPPRACGYVLTMLIFSTRAEAKAAGAKRYFTGVPCANGHLSERYVGGACVACQAEHGLGNKAKTAAFRAANRELLRTRNKEYVEKNREEINTRRAIRNAQNPEPSRVRASIWYHANRERALKACRTWASENKAATRNAKHKYKIKRKAVSAFRLSDFDTFAIVEACDLAVRREKLLGGKWHVDHMVPLFAKEACGLHVAANLAVIPASVNMRKQNKFIFTTPGSWLGAV